MYLQPRSSQSRSAPKTTTTATTATRSPTQTNKKDPDAIKLDAGTQGYTPKNFAERQKCIKEGRCFKYNSKNYLSPNCSIPIPHAGAPGTDIAEMESRLSSPGGMLLNELP